MKQLLRQLLSGLLHMKALVIATGLLGIVGLLICVFVLWPQYRNPQTRMYTSGLGYGSLQRKLGKAFPVEVSTVQETRVEIPYLGEGLVAGDPVRVSIIPMARVEEVLVNPGDRVEAGDVLLRLDDREAKRKLASAGLALKTAEAELKRVKIGSAYVLAQERPEHDRIRLEAAEEEQAHLEKKLLSYERSLARGLIAETEVLQIRQSLAAATKESEERAFFSSISSEGAEHSLVIAQNAAADAAQALAYAESQLADYTLTAPVDGLVSEVLIRAGEFNQDFGKPAFVLTEGIWFDGYFDQTALADLKPDMPGEVVLEAFPGKHWEAVVERVISEVSFASGGPEVGRPLRPRGTGAPEWAATFRVRLRFIDPPSPLVHGMTGNVRILAQRDALVVPRNAPLSIAAGRGLVMVPDEEEGNQWAVRGVELGAAEDGWQEIRGGMRSGERVFSGGHRILREGDKVEIDEVAWTP